MIPEELHDKLVELFAEGFTTKEIHEQLFAEGYRVSPRQIAQWWSENKDAVLQHIDEEYEVAKTALQPKSLLIRTNRYLKQHPVETLALEDINALFRLILNIVEKIEAEQRRTVEIEEEVRRRVDEALQKLNDLQPQIAEATRFGLINLEVR